METDFLRNCVTIIPVHRRVDYSQEMIDRIRCGLKRLCFIRSFLLEDGMSKTNDFTTGKILMPLIGFMLPVFFAMFLQSMYGAVDLLIVGRFAQSMDVSAVSTGSQMMMTIVLAEGGVAGGRLGDDGEFSGLGRSQRSAAEGLGGVGNVIDIGRQGCHLEIVALLFDVIQIKPLGGEGEMGGVHVTMGHDAGETVKRHLIGGGAGDRVPVRASVRGLAPPDVFRTIKRRIRTEIGNGVGPSRDCEICVGRDSRLHIIHAAFPEERGHIGQDDCAVGRDGDRDHAYQGVAEGRVAHRGGGK